jgi:hypothetical protein
MVAALPWLGALLLYGAYGLAGQFPLLAVLGSHVYGQNLPGNDSLLHVWSLAWGQHALATDPRHALDANIFHPYPLTLLYSDHLLALALLLAPLRLVTDDVVLVHNALVVAAPILNALAMFALVRDLTGRTGAALVGGFLYGFAPMRLEFDRTQVQMLAAWWLPLLLLFGRRAILSGRWRDAVAAGVAWWAQAGSSIYLTAFFAPFLALAHVTWAVRFPPTRHRQGWVRLATCELGACLALVPLAVAYRSVQTSLGAARSPVLSGLLTLGTSLAQRHAYLPVATVIVALGAGTLAWRRLPAALRAERRFHLAIAAGALLLAFGPALPLPFGWGRLWGPYGLLMSLPGFTALRAPGRMVHVTLLGIAALAAFGWLAATAAWSARARRAATAALLVLAAVECWPPAYELSAAPEPAVLDPVYAWLAHQDDDVRIAEVPLDAYTQAAQTYQYASTGHWRKTLGGSMGILPPAYPYMARALGRFPDRDVLADLRALGITHVVVHGRLLPPAARAALEARVRTSARWLKRRWQRDGTAVYAIRPGLRSSPERLVAEPPLAREAWRATATHANAAAGRAIDDDPATSWSSWGDLEENLETRWYDAVPFVERWRRFLATQPARLTIDLGAVHEVRGLDVRLAGTDPQAVPAVRVETSLDGHTWQPVPAALRPLPDVRGFVTDAARLRMGRRLAPPVALRYIRLSCDGYEWQVADVQLHGT